MNKLIAVISALFFSNCLLSQLYNLNNLMEYTIHSDSLNYHITNRIYLDTVSYVVYGDSLNNQIHDTSFSVNGKTIFVIISGIAWDRNKNKLYWTDDERRLGKCMTDGEVEVRVKSNGDEVYVNYFYRCNGAVVYFTFRKNGEYYKIEECIQGTI